MDEIKKIAIRDTKDFVDIICKGMSENDANETLDLRVGQELNIEKIAIPNALSTPERLKYVRCNILDTLYNRECCK